VNRRILSGAVVYHFSPDAEPRWYIAPGEKVQVQCPDGMHGTIQTEEDLYLQVDPDRVNDAVGPIYIEGARAGTTLCVSIERITVPSTQGYVLLIPGFGLLKDRIERAVTKICPIEDGCVNFDGVRIPLDPCIGTIGVAPAQGRISTLYPGDHGGNMDTTDIRSGVNLYLPVFVDGALLAMGDGKAVMGDGEVCGTGVGVPLNIDLTCTVRDPIPVRRPIIETADSWMTIGSAPTLEEAARVATLDMIALLQASHGFSFERAYMFTSLVGHLKISQVVDPWMTVRMSIDKRYLSKPLVP